MSKVVDEIVKSDFPTFAAKALSNLDGTVLDNDPYVELLSTQLTDFADGDTKRLLINMPPRHGKTKLGSICCSAWILAHNPRSKILIITYAKDLAESISRSIRDILQARWFKELFPTRVAKGHARTNNFATTAGGEVYATSFDGSVTGFGGDTIVIDDAHNIADVKNPDLLAETIGKFHSIIVRRLNNPKKGRILVLGHRVHESDLSADLIESGDWTHLALPIVAPRNQTYETAYGRWKRKKGELLRPDADDLGNLDKLRSKLVNPSFELLYQQDVEELARPALTADHFLSYELEDIWNLPRFISIDPGTDEGDRRSFNVVQLWASDGTNHYLVEQSRKRCNFRELVQITKAVVRKNSGAPILIEKTANGPALISELSKRQRRRPHAITPRVSKTARLRRHYETFLAFRISVRNDAPYRDKFIEEFVQFPHGPHNDQVDATTQFLDFIVAQDGIDFSDCNVSRPGVVAGAHNSEYRGLPSSVRSVPAVMAVALNSNRVFGGFQPQDPKAPGLIAGGRPQMPNAPFPEVKAWVRW